jgi:hypothetical protein
VSSRFAGVLVGLALAVLLTGWTARADEGVRVRLELEPRIGTVGDPFRARLTVEAPRGWTLHASTPGLRWRPLVVRRGTWQGPIPLDRRTVRWVWDGTLAAYEPGDLELPPWPLRLAGPDGEQEYPTSRERLTIRSVLPPIAADEPLPEIADLKPPVSLQPDWRPLRRALALLAGLAVLGAACGWVYRRLAPRFASVPALPDPFRRQPPHEWAFHELQRLLDGRPSGRPEVEELFARLSGILKSYLEGRYRLDLRDATTPETGERLRRRVVPHATVSAAVALLLACDRVKFARETPGPEACRSAVEEAYRIVDRSRPVEAPEGATTRGAA